MKRLLSICFALILAFACITPVYAAEDTVSYTFDNELFPDLEVESKYTDLLFLWDANGVYRLRIYDVLDYEHLFLYPNSSRYNYLWCEGINGYEFVEYSLRDGNWRLDNTVSWPNDTYFNFGSVSLDSVVYTSADIRKSSTTDSELLFAANYDIETGTGTGNIPEEDDGSSEGGGFTGSWSDEDKGWLGNLFGDLYDFFNNFYNNLKSKLDSIATSITNSIGNFISSATTSISTFINNAVSSISEFFSNLSDTIETVRLKIEEFFTGMFDALYEFFENLIQGIKDWWSELWQPVLDWLDEQKAEKEAKDSVWESLKNSIGALLDYFVDTTITPVKEFFDSISEGAIFVWLSFFRLPFIRDLALAVVLVAIFGGILTLLLTF